MSDPAVVTQEVIDAITARAPKGAEVTGEHHDDTGAWTWAVIIPAPTPEDPTVKHGISRQYVPTEQDPTPSTEAINSMVTEMLSTLEGAA